MAILRSQAVRYAQHAPGVLSPTLLRSAVSDYADTRANGQRDKADHSSVPEHDRPVAISWCLALPNTALAEDA